MSKYTTEVRFICETESGLSSSEGGARVNDIIAGSRAKIFNFSYPIFDEAYRPVLETKILKHYYTREIGLETVGLWKLKLDTKMNEIMPLYNLYYRSALLEFNPLYTKNITREKDNTITRENDETENTVGTSVTEATKTNEATATETDNVVDSVDSTSEVHATSNSGKTSEEYANGTIGNTTTNSGTSTVATNGTSSEDGTSSVDTLNKDLYSDTPQGALTGVDNETYLTNARKITNGSDSEYSVDRTNSETVNGTTGNTETSSGTSSNNSTVTDTINSADNSMTTNAQDSTRNATKNNTSENEENTDINVSIANEKSKSKDETTVEDYLEHVYGFEGGSASKLLKEYRETFINIDMMVINDLEELFMQLW